VWREGSLLPPLLPSSSLNIELLNERSEAMLEIAVIALSIATWASVVFLLRQVLMLREDLERLERELERIERNKVPIFSWPEDNQPF
jgi:hypothetical protein